MFDKPTRMERGLRKSTGKAVPDPELSAQISVEPARMYVLMRVEPARIHTQMPEMTCCPL